jgi:hypothetical protein
MNSDIKKSDDLLKAVRSLIAEDAVQGAIENFLYMNIIEMFLKDYLPILLKNRKFTIHNDDIEAMSNIFISEQYNAKEYYEMKHKLRDVNKNVYFSMNDYEEIVRLKDCEAEIKGLDEDEEVGGLDREDESSTLLGHIKKLIHQCMSYDLLIEQQIISIEGFLYWNIATNFIRLLSNMKDDLSVQKNYELNDIIIETFLNTVPEYEECAVTAEDYVIFKKMVQNIDVKLYEFLSQLENNAELEACKAEINSVRDKFLSPKQLANKIMGNQTFTMSFDSGVSASMDLLNNKKK